MINSILKEKSIKEKNRIKRIKIIILLLILFSLFILGSLLGKYSLSLGDVFKTLFGFGSEESNKVIFQIRVPRLLLALLTGLLMGDSGVIMQNLLHNDLASPGTLGVSDGSTLFVTIYMTFMSTQSSNPFLMPILALLGGLISSGIIYLLSFKKGKKISPTRLVLTGVAISALYQAIGQFMVFIMDENKLAELQSWQAGELWAANTSRPYLYILILFVWFLVFGGYALYKSRTLNAINLGYDVATGIGVATKKEFLVLSFIAVALSSAAVAFGGNFFFLGLIGPHIARRIVGHDAKYLIPTSGIVAGIMVMASNILVTDFDIFLNIPTGIFVSIISVPYFIYLLLKRR